MILSMLAGLNLLMAQADDRELASPPPAGQSLSGQLRPLFEEWLSAMNSGDAAAIRAFYAKHLDDADAAYPRDVAEDTCGFDLVRVEAQGPLNARLLLAERCFPALQRLTIRFESSESPKPAEFELQPFALSRTGAIDAVSGIADRLAARDKFAGALIVAQGDAPGWTRSWGRLDRTSDMPVTADTPMFLASAGKMFTAVSILQLVDAGKVDLDAPLGRYLIDYPNAETAKVTIRQLLQHRGGTGDIGILAREEGANRTHVRTIDDIIRLNGSRAPEFPPGSKTDYSNYGFILLGAVVQRVSGEDYYDYVRDHVFVPAGMTHASYPDHDHLAGIAIGYTTFFGKEAALTSNVDVLPWRGGPAGGGVASANDMLRFFRALKSGKLLSPTMFKLATTAGATPWYGLGFVVDPSTPTHWGHGGGSYGMSAGTGYYPDSDTYFICLATRDMACDRMFYAWHFRMFGLTD